MNTMNKTGIGLCLCGLAMTCAAAEAVPSAVRVRQVGDGVCTVGEIVTGAVLRVDFRLCPEPGSNIRCRIELPPAARWDGRMWGVGNSGWAGSFLPISQFSAWGTAVATTDLGTAAYTENGKSNEKVWPDCVRRDYDWRATHLMTVYAKRIVEAYYGRPPSHCYFDGGSCGGRQGIGEAIRFPEDYDGIIAHMPGNNPICNEVDDFILWKLTHDVAGKLLFTEDEMHAVSDAAVAYGASRTERPFSGKVLADPFFTADDVDGFLSLAAQKVPRLADPDLRSRLRRLFLGTEHRGRRMTYGKIPGSYLGDEMRRTWHAYFPQFLRSRGLTRATATLDDLDEFVRLYAPTYNACSDDLEAFRRRGGKLIVTPGLEDQTDPPRVQIAHFERVVSRLGGDLSAALSFYRVFPVPGCAHGGGKGRIITIPPDGPTVWRQMIDWREKGIAPERFMVPWKDEGVDIPVAPYPKRLVQDEYGNWIERTFDRSRMPSVDPFYLQCETRLPDIFAMRVPLSGTVDLSGVWQAAGTNFNGRAVLPGTLASARLGMRWTEQDFRTTMDLPQSEALVQEWQYVGKATWTRTVELSKAECAAPMELFLERVMWTSAAFWDGQPLGTCDSLATPHVYALPKLTPGRHELRLEIDNGNHYGFSRQSHAYGPNMQAVWNGVLGKVELRRAHPLRAARVFAGADGRLSVETTAEVAAVEVEGLAVASWKQEGVRVAISLGEKPVVWNEFHPQLYTVRLTAKDGFVHSVRFGFRTYGTNGRHITLNGNDIFTRGNVENANFAKDGTPWMTKAEWAAMLKTLRDEDGVNAIRFHSWCPPSAAFAAADELGIMLQPEAGIWTDKWMSEGDEIGNGKPVDGFVRRELKAIVDAYGNSPSFLSLSIGNELGNSNFRKMGEMIAELRAYDPRALYYASSARDLSGADDFLLSHKVGDNLAREKLLPHTNWDYEEIYAASKVPTVAHEIGQWPVYPLWDDLLGPFTGTMRPWNLSRHRDTAAKRNALRFQREYHAASAKLNRLIYKEEVESFLRTPSCAGLQLLNVQDYTGQAEALVGWRDPFYGLKAGFRGLPPFSSVWGPVSYLARFPKFTWTVGETFAAKLQIRNLTSRTIPSGTEYSYAVVGTSGVLRLAEDVHPGVLADVGEVRIALTAGMTKSKHELRFGTNRWNFWVYPQEGVCALPDGVIETSDPERMKSEVRAGKTVLYRGPSFRCGKGQFKSVYWSARWFPVDNTVTAALGTWFDKDHPALAGFVTDDFTDWQWYDLAEGGVVHSLLGLPQEYRPIGLSVNDFHFSEFAATLFEVMVGKGRLFVCGYDVGKDSPAAKRLRASIAEYLSRSVAPGTPTMDEAWLEREFDVSPKKEDLSDAVYDSAPAWTGSAYKIELKGFAPVTGTVRIDFHQPEDGLTSGRGILEGRVFEVPFTEQKGKKVSVTLPIIREDMLDGKLELSVNLMTGRALAIDRIRVFRSK